jgi:glycosyltransferase involved in cell wall biosynthesis
MGVGEWIGASRATLLHTGRIYLDNPRIVFLDQRWAHHGRHSGYLASTNIGPCLPRKDRIVPEPVRKFWADRVDDYYWEQRWLFWINVAASRAALVHLVDGDFDSSMIRNRPRWSRAKVTATFHQTVDRLDELVAPLRQGMLDGIVCVSRGQKAHLEHLVPPDRCVFVPHGVDTEFFRPPETQTKAAPLLLAVGVHRRDFATLVAAATLVKERRPDVTIRLIGLADRVEAVGASAKGAIQVMSGVTDDSLRAAYQAASMLFLPLEEATANNALLEAMACGKPAVTTDLPGLRDYVDERAAVFCPRSEPEAYAEAALALLDDESRLAEMGRAARAQALLLEWPRVREELLAFFNRVID